VQADLVDDAGGQALAHDVGPASDRDVLAACGGSGLVEGVVSPAVMKR
jgi:hypothetical protein